MDIRPPKSHPPAVLPSESHVLPPVQPAVLPDIPLDIETKPLVHRSGKKLGIIIGCALLFIVASGVAAFMLYRGQLAPVDATSKQSVRLTVVINSTPSQIADELAQHKLIRSQRAFDIYTRLTKTRNKLQAGTYMLAPSLSTPEIVDHLVSGKVDTFQMTFFPGGTLTDDSNKPLDEKLDVQSALQRVGFTKDQINDAFSASYNSPLFAGKPASASLEGYVYGETYVVDSSMSAQQVLQMTFDEFYKQVKANDLIAGFQAQGLTLYQGITLASIVQAEMGSHKADMPQVAQVFLKRLSIGMPLGSDVTAYYGAKQIGASQAVSVDTPYNTRIHAGLPPGPIGSPSLAALQAVAHPAAGDYLFFLSGDDGTTYFSTTDAEHEANIAAHCQKLCAML